MLKKLIKRIIREKAWKAKKKTIIQILTPRCRRDGKSFFKPDAFSDEISRLGYKILENISPAEINRKCFLDRADGLVTHSAAYNIHAEIIKD